MRKSDKKAGFDRMAYITYENIYKNAKTKRRETAEYFFQLNVVQFAKFEKTWAIYHTKHCYLLNKMKHRINSNYQNKN